MNYFFFSDLLSNGNHPKGVIAVFRDCSALETDDSKLAVLAHARVKTLKRRLEDALPEGHIIRLE